MRREDMEKVIQLSKAELQCDMSRVRWAEGLIVQLPNTHDGRNSWLMNYGVGEEATKIRARIEKERGEQLQGWGKADKLEWDDVTNCLKKVRY